MILVSLLLLQAVPELVPAAGASGSGSSIGQQSPAGAAPGDNEFKAYYKDGLRFETMDGAYKFRMGGRINFDTAYVGNNQAIRSTIRPVDLEDGSAFRRARLYVSGTLHEEVDFKAQYDFAGGAANFRDVYLAFPHFPVGTLTVGQFKEPFSLEEVSSANDITFMERSLANTFSPSRSTGLALNDDFADSRATWGAGLFRASNAFGNAFNDADWSVTGRVTGLPVWEDDGATFLHLGVSASRRAPTGDLQRFRTRPESFIAPVFVDTGNFASDEETRLGAEAAFVSGRGSLQGEYTQVESSLVAGADATFSGYYLEGSWFLTDDHRSYDPKKGYFVAVKPKGGDAVEAKLRYSAVDLNDGAVAGGELSDVTAGVNWYLNSNVRLMFEVVNADIDGVDNTIIGQVRCQVVW